MKPNREYIKDQFIAAAGWGDAHSVAMAADASGRSYERLSHGTQSVILMNAPYCTGEDVRPFIAVTQMLRVVGLSAPKILAQDTEHGFLLLEDFGDDLFAQLCKTDANKETMLYEAAIDVLVELHRHPVSDLPDYDEPTYIREANLLTEWYLPATTLTPTSAGQIANFNAIISKACQTIDAPSKVLVLRDYHAENLIWLPQRNGIHRVGLLDYQDALAGHPAYDLVSLLQDARRDTSAGLQEKMLQRYLTANNTDAVEFTSAFNILGMQRNIKILGIFSRLCIRDKKQHYVDLIPRVWRHVQDNLQHPACHEAKLWFTQNVPEPTADILNKIKGAA